MNTVNPDANTEQKSEDKQKSLSNEQVRELIKDPKKFDELPEVQKAEFHERFVSGDEEGVLEEHEETSQKDPVSNSSAQELVSKPVESEDIQVLKRKLKEEKDLNNTLSQRLESTQKKLASIDELKIPLPPKVEDEYDITAMKTYDYLKNTATKHNKALDLERENLSRDIEQLRREQQKVEIARTFTDISTLQVENPELRTSKPIEVIDKAYAKFRDDIAGSHATEEEKTKAFDKYLSDPEFKRAKEAEGYIFPIDQRDWKNYNMIHQVRNFKSQNKLPDMDLAYYKFKKETGIIPDRFQQIALETATKVANQLNPTSDATILSPNDGKTGFNDGKMSDAEIERWLIQHPSPSTPEELSTFAVIRKQLGMG